MPELAAIAWATGATVTELAGTGTVADRAECAARATNHADMDSMRDALLHFLELDDYLHDQAIPVTVLSRWENVDRGDGGLRGCHAVRQEHHLGVQPLGDLLEIIEQATGIDVAVLDACQTSMV